MAVHVRICPLVASGKVNKRGNPSTEFYRDGVPQIYCLGYFDSRNEEPLAECEVCLDFVHGLQCDIDYEVAETFNRKREDGGQI